MSVERLELSTNGLKGRCSTIELHTRSGGQSIMPIWARQSFPSGGWPHCLFSGKNGSWNNLNSVTYHTCIKEHLCYHASITIRNCRMPSCRRSRLFRPPALLCFWIHLLSGIAAEQLILS